MADYNEDHAAKLKHLYKVAVKQNEKAKALIQRVADLEAAGAQANKIESIKVNGTAQTIGSDKSVNITVPTKVSQLSNDSGYQTGTQVSDAVTKAVAAADHLKRKVVASAAAISTSAADAAQYIYMVPKGTGKDADKYDEYMVIDGVLEKVGGWEVDLTGYVKKETGKGLSTNDFTTKEKNKLAGLAEGANKYVHPSYTAKAGGLYKVTVDATGHVSAAAAVTKEDITALGIPGSDTKYGNATTTNAGLMSAADKTKLDGLVLATDEEVDAMLKEIYGGDA